MYVQTNKSAIIYYMSSESVPVLSCKMQFWVFIYAIYLRFSVKGFDCLTFIVCYYMKYCTFNTVIRFDPKIAFRDDWKSYNQMNEILFPLVYFIMIHRETFAYTT